MVSTKASHVLYVVHRLPYPPDKGDRIRAFHIIRHLSQMAKVDVVALADEPVGDHEIAELKRYCHRLAVVRQKAWLRWPRTLGYLAIGKTATEGAFASNSAIALLKQWAQETHYDSCLASSSGVVPFLEIDELCDVPAVVDLVDVDSQKWLDYADASRGPKRWLYGIEGRRLRRLERELPHRARAVTLVSQAEVDIYRAFADGGLVRAIVNGVDQTYFQPQRCDSESGLVFVGALDYRPNVDGASWFCQEVWPAIYRARPESKVYLVGRRPAAAVRQLATIAGVELVGQVKDVRPYLAKAAIAIVPLRLARGVQNKVLEAMAMGKAVIASPQALAGLRSAQPLPVVEATTPEQWIQAVFDLLKDPQHRKHLGQLGRRYVEANHHWERCLEPFNELLRLSAPKTNGHPTAPNVAINDCPLKKVTVS